MTTLEHAHLEPLARRPLRERVFDILLGLIVSGELAPGTRLRDVDLAEQFGVSRTPVREALQHLESMALVETRPGSMTTVRQIEPSEAADAFPVVADLHALAARMAVPLLTDDHIAAMEAHNSDLTHATERGNSQAMIAADTRFHDVFIEVAANSVIVDVLTTLTPRVRRYEYALFDGTTSAHDHDRIIAHSRAGDVEEVAQLTLQNWLTLGETVQARMAGRERDDDGDPRYDEDPDDEDRHDDQDRHDDEDPR